MTIEHAVSSDAGPVLFVQTQGSDRTLQAGPSYRIGRDPQSDIPVDDSRVSWQHATLRLEQGGWLLEDAGSTNGMFVGPDRVQRVEITGRCEVRLGHPEDGPTVACTIAVAKAGAGSTELAASPSPAASSASPASAAPAPPPAWPASAAPAPPPAWPAAPYASPAAQYAPPAAAYAPPAAAPAPPMRPPASPFPAAQGTYDRPGHGEGRRPSAVMSLPARVLRIGRAADNEVVVSDLSVSRYHAELRKTPRGGYEIVDLASHNGTFLNGQRIGSAPVTEMDIIGVGPATFRLVGEELQEFIDTGDVSLSARDLTVRLPNGKVLLDHVSFPLGERCLLGVIGPSGAGKSTLLGALTGIRPATDGSVLYDNRDLYTHYAELRHRIGLVPQENILHTQLSARRALGYAAELRFPRDTSKGERRRRIDEVLSELSLSAHADTRTDRLSGGQQKRVNVALELLTKPSLLFLDEPTSGLDPGLDKSVMEMMAGLAHDGRTVIVVTHSVANLHLCDRLLVLVPGGKVAFFGPPQDGLRHFGKPGWAEVFQAFDAEPNRDWAGEFRRSPLYARYIAAEMDGGSAVSGPRQAGAAPPATRNRLAQLSTLYRRYLAVIASSRVYLALLAGAPIALAAAIRVIPAPDGLAGAPGTNAAATGLLLILAISACFTGTVNAVGEIVKERAIYSRERAAGLSAGSYLLSKLLVLGLISGLQAVILVVAGLTGKKLPADGAFLKHLPLIELLLAMGALAVTSMALGLMISAMVNSSEKAMPLLLVTVVIQVVLSGGVFAIGGKVGVEQIAWLSPSRWGYAAAAATSNLNVIGASTSGVPPVPVQTPATGKAHTAGSTPAAGKTHRHPKTHGTGKTPGTAKTTAAAPSTATASAADPLWKRNPQTWLTDMALMVVLGLAFTLIAWWRLVRLSPGRRR